METNLENVSIGIRTATPPGRLYSSTELVD
jgi:hypothetical protein